MAGLLDYGDSISNIESGGKYDALGPTTKSGDRAYGKYQVMGANIPVWTKEILGAPMSPEEFLSNPQAQDAVFQGKFGQYAEKYGPEGAAQAWFGGPGAVGKTYRKDQLGTSVGAYGQKFMAGLPPQAQAATGAPQPPPQQPLPPQPLNLAAQVPQAQPQQSPLPAYGFSPQAQPAQPVELPQAQVLNAPQLQPLIRQFNLRNAFAKIPTPAGFKGFNYSQG